MIHNDLTPVNRVRAATAGVVVNTPAAATTTTTNNIDINTITNTTTTAPTTSTSMENNTPRLFNNFSNSKPHLRAQSPKVTSPTVAADKPPPVSPAKPKRTSGNHTGVPESPRVPVQSPKVSSQSPKPTGVRGVQFGAVETIPRENEDSYPAEPPPVVPKKPLIPARNSVSPPTSSVSSPHTNNIPPVTSSSDQGYYVFSPDDDESSSEGDYDEDETTIAAGKYTKHIFTCITHAYTLDRLAAKVIRRDSIAILAERRRKEQIASE